MLVKRIFLPLQVKIQFLQSLLIRIFVKDSVILNCVISN